MNLKFSCKENVFAIFMYVRKAICLKNDTEIIRVALTICLTSTFEISLTRGIGGNVPRSLINRVGRQSQPRAEARYPKLGIGIS